MRSGFHLLCADIVDLVGKIWCASLTAWRFLISRSRGGYFLAVHGASFRRRPRDIMSKAVGGNISEALADSSQSAPNLRTAA
jgi:hypothetical protein